MIKQKNMIPTSLYEKNTWKFWLQIRTYDHNFSKSKSLFSKQMKWFQNKISDSNSQIKSYGSKSQMMMLNQTRWCQLRKNRMIRKFWMESGMLIPTCPFHKFVFQTLKLVVKKISKHDTFLCQNACWNQNFRFRIKSSDSPIWNQNFQFLDLDSNFLIFWFTWSLCLESEFLISSTIIFWLHIGPGQMQRLKNHCISLLSAIAAPYSTRDLSW